MFFSIPAEEHALRKRMVALVYSKSFAQTSLAVTSQALSVLLGRLLPVLTTVTANDPLACGVEVFSLFLATSMDFITAHVYGLAGGTDFLSKTAFRAH